LIRLNSHTAESYRFTFQGQESDDEVKGEGNSYDFKARMLDPRVGRFLAIDAKSSEYSSIGPYTFVNNMPLWAIDPDGNDIIVLSAPSGANGMGHGAVLIGNDKDGWKLYSKNGVGEHTSGNSSGSKGESYKPDQGVEFKTLEEFANSEKNFYHGEVYYTSAFRITTTKEQDQKMEIAALKQVNKDYYLTTSSCIDVCSDALIAAGLDPGMKQVTHDPKDKKLPDIPNVRFAAIVKNNKGVDVSNLLKPSQEGIDLERIANTPNFENTLIDMGSKYNSRDADNTRVFNPQVQTTDNRPQKNEAKEKLKEIRTKKGG
jgi:RHS repeat-associated protein